MATHVGEFLHQDKVLTLVIQQGSCSNINMCTDRAGMLFRVHHIKPHSGRIRSFARENELFAARTGGKKKKGAGATVKGCAGQGVLDGGTGSESGAGFKVVDSSNFSHETS